MEIPYVGSIYIRNNVAAVKFNENLEEDVKVYDLSYSPLYKYL